MNAQKLESVVVNEPRAAKYSGAQIILFKQLALHRLKPRPPWRGPLREGWALGVAIVFAVLALLLKRPERVRNVGPGERPLEEYEWNAYSGSREGWIK